MLAALLLLLDAVPIVGIVAQTADGWVLEIEGLKETSLALVAATGGISPSGFKGKRVQVRGESDGKAITIKTIDELQARENDLVLTIRAKGDRVHVLEYLPVKGHKHPGQSCKSHAWVRATIEAQDGRVTREVRVPAYKNLNLVRIFVRVEGKSGAADSAEWSLSGAQWLDKDLTAIDKPLEISLEAP